MALDKPVFRTLDNDFTSFAYSIPAQRTLTKQLMELPLSKY